MKVLKLGKEVTVNCPMCSSTLLVEAGDWKQVTPDTLKAQVRLYVNCPVCKNKIYQDWVLSLYNQDDVHIRSNKEVKSVGIDSAWDDCKEGIMEVDFNNPDPHFATQEGKPI